MIDVDQHEMLVGREALECDCVVHVEDALTHHLLDLMLNLFEDSEQPNVLVLI